MKNKKLIALTLIVVSILCFVLGACEQQEQPTMQEPQAREQTTPENEIAFSDEQTDVEEIKIFACSEITQKYSAKTTTCNQEDKQVLDIVLLGIKAQINAITCSADEAKTVINNLYKELLEAIELVKTQQETFALQKQNTLAKLDLLYESIIKIINEVNVDYITSIFNQAREQISGASDSSEGMELISQAFESFVDIGKNYALHIIDDLLATAVSMAKLQLKTVYQTAMLSTNDESIKSLIEQAYNIANISLSKIIDGSTATTEIDDAISQFKADIYDYASQVLQLSLQELKNIAIGKLDNAVETALELVKDEQLKAQLQEYYTQQKNTILTIDDVDTAKTAITNIKDNTVSFVTNLLAQQLTKLKATAKTELDTLVNGYLSKIDDTELQASLTDYYNTQIELIMAIDSVESAETALATIKTNTINKAKDIVAQQLTKLKTAAKNELDTLVGDYLSKIDDTELQASLTDYYDTQIALIMAIDSIDSAKTTLATIKTNTINKAKEIVAQQLTKLKTTAKNELDTLVGDYLSKIDDTELQASLTDYYDTQIELIMAIDSIESAKTTLATIKTNTINKAKEIATQQLAKLKTAAKNELDTLVGGYLSKIEDTELKVSLTDYYDTQIELIMAIDSIDNAKATLATIKTNTINKAKEIIAQQLVKIKNTAITQLQNIVTTAIGSIEDDDLQTALETLLNKQIAKLNAIDSLDDIDTTIAGFVAELEEDAATAVTEYLTEKLNDLKESFISKINSAKNQILGKVSDEEKKTAINEIITNALTDINNIDDPATAQESLQQIFDNAISDINETLNRGYAVSKVHNGMLYYVSLFDNTLYKYNPNTKQHTSLEIKYIADFFFNGDVLYYSTYDEYTTVNFALWRLDSETSTTVKVSSNRYEKLIFDTDCVYAIRTTGVGLNNYLVKMDYATFTETKLEVNDKNMHIHSLEKIGNYLYYCTNPAVGYKTLWQYDIVNNTCKEFTNGLIKRRAELLISNGDTIYYYDQDKNELNSFDASQNKSTKIDDNVTITDMYFTDDNIYYVSTNDNNFGLYCYNISSKTTTQLHDKQVHGISVIGSTLYCFEVDITFKNDYAAITDESSKNLIAIDITQTNETQIIVSKN